MRSVLVASLLVILAGCATSHVMVGNARPAISPSQVKIYLHPPEKYEEIAILDTSSQGSFSFTQQGKMDSVVERLKAAWRTEDFPEHDRRAQSAWHAHLARVLHRGQVLATVADQFGGGDGGSGGAGGYPDYR